MEQVKRILTELRHLLGSWRDDHAYQQTLQDLQTALLLQTSELLNGVRSDESFRILRGDEYYNLLALSELVMRLAARLKAVRSWEHANVMTQELGLVLSSVDQIGPLSSDVHHSRVQPGPTEAVQFNIQASKENEAANPAATTLSVWFGTNRKLTAKGKKGQTFGEEANEEDVLSYGRAKVTVPDVHELASIERPKWWKFEWNEDPDKHIVVSSVNLFDPQKWARDAHSFGSEGLLFIHGFNVTFEEALWRSAQLTFDLKFTGVPLCFSWASMGAVGKYAADEEIAQWSGHELAKFIVVARSQLGLSKVHVIAHSMGSRVLHHALQWMAMNPPTASQAPFGQVVLAAADMGVRVFRQVQHLFMTGDMLTAYASRADRALLASKVVHDSPRLGDANPPTVLPGMETVDVTSAGKEMFGVGHSYFGSNRPIFSDLYAIIQNGLPAAKRVSVKHQLPEGYYVLL